MLLQDKRFVVVSVLGFCTAGLLASSNYHHTAHNYLRYLPTFLTQTSTDLA